jgi:hypothetical protein
MNICTDDDDDDDDDGRGAGSAWTKQRETPGALSGTLCGLRQSSAPVRLMPFPIEVWHMVIVPAQ